MKAITFYLLSGLVSACIVLGILIAVMWIVAPNEINNIIIGGL